TLMRRQSPSSSHGGDNGENEGVPFRTPFLTFAIVAVAVFVVIIFLIVLRLMVWNRRARMYPDMVGGGYAFFARPSLPLSDMVSPPPLLEKTVSACHPASHIHNMQNAPPVNWAAIQPVSVSFDEHVS